MTEIQIAWLELMTVGGLGVILVLLGVTFNIIVKRQNQLCTKQTDGIVKQYGFPGNGRVYPIVEYFVNGTCYKTKKIFCGIKTTQISGVPVPVKSEVYEDEKGWLHVKTGSIANLRQLAEQLWPINSKMTVYYNPNNPKKCYVDRPISKSFTSMEHLKPLLPAGGDASELEAAAQALAGLSPEDRDLLAAVQESPFRLTTLEQFREFPANTEYFVLEPNIRKVEDVGWRYLAQHLDVLLPPELLDAIDPVPFGNHAMQEEQGCFTSRGYLTLSGDEWEHERPRERQTEKKPSIKERLEQSRKECANQSKAQPHREKPAPER